MSGLGLTFLRRGGQAHPTAGSDYILSEGRGDPEVFRILMANGVSSDGVGITRDDAAKVTTIGDWFRTNTSITSFDEFKYFLSVRQLSVTAASSNNSPFFRCSNLTSIVLPEGLEVIGAYAFSECTSLQNIELPTTIKSIYSQAFYEVPAKMVINLPNLVGGIPSQVFKQSGVTRVENLGSITSLGGGWNQGVFYGCASLVFVRLPKTLVDIGTYVFQNCSALSTVICEAETPPTLGANNNGLNNATIYVPDASIDAYKAAANWSTHASRIKPLSEYQG